MKMIMWMGLYGLGWLGATGWLVAEPSRSGQDTSAVQVTGETAWLGVELGPVPDLLAAHLQLQIDTPSTDTTASLPSRNRGLIVVNLFRDSPADRAGLERYDVIVEADGEKVSGDVSVFTRHVRDKKPGDSMNLTLIRGGKTVNINVVLEHRTRPYNELVLKYPQDPFLPQGGLRGRILHRGPDGRWVLEDLGTMPWADGHGQEWAQRLDEEISRRLTDKRLEQDRSEIHEAFHVDDQGRVVHVRRAPDGTITVKRYRQSEGPEQAEVKTYRDLRELREKDPTAAQLLQPTDLRDEVKQYVEELREYIPDLRQWYKQKEPFRKVPEKWREWEENFFQGPMQRFRYFMRLSTPATAPGEEEAPPADVRFDIDPQGRVTVTVREPDAELTMTYPSVEEFQKQAPDLYARFAKIREKIR